MFDLDVCSEAHQNMEKDGPVTLVDEYQSDRINTRYYSDLFIDDIELCSRTKTRKENRNSMDDQCASEYLREEFPPPMPYVKRRDISLDIEASERCGDLDPTSSKVRAVVALRSPHSILFVSDPFVKWLGYTPQELVGRSLRVLSGPKTDTFALHAAIKNAALLNFECIETIVYSSSGVSHHVLVSCIPFMDMDGALLGCSLEVKQLAKPQRDLNNFSPIGPTLIPFGPRTGSADAARRRAYNYRTGLALHAEHRAPAAVARMPDEDDILERLLASL
jgi:PAS domain-containing protein